MNIKNISLTNSHTQLFGLSVLFRRKLLTLRQLSHGRTFTSTSLMPQLVQAVLHIQHGVFVDSKGSGNLLRIICILPTSLHIRRVLIVPTYTIKRNVVSQI